MSRFAANLLMLALALWGAPCAMAKPVMVHPAPPSSDNAPILAKPSALLVADEGSINWTPTLLQGSNVTYSASSLPTGASINSSTGAITGTLSTTDKWVVEVTATNNDGEDTVWLPVSVYASTANISQSSGFPYYLNTANRKYTLTENITVDGSAFAVIAENCSLDLNGHTVTYGNVSPISLANASFETGSGTAATGWDFTNAPNADRYAGVFLSNEIYDGSYSLKFTDCTGDEDVENTTTVTLDANTTYSLTAMFQYGVREDSNPGVNAYVRLIPTGAGSTRTISKNSTYFRGIQMLESIFTTGGSSETYEIHAGIEGHASAVKPQFIDDIKIQRARVYGVCVSPKSWNPTLTPDLTSYGEGNDATILNGTIVQGQGAGARSHGVYVYTADGFGADGLNVTVNGPSTSCLFGNTNTAYWSTIHGCTLTSNVETITNRDAYEGSVTTGIVGSITSNEITDGPHAGIRMGGGTGAMISDNEIRLKVKYTNPFAILGNASSWVYRNRIYCGEGDYASHGIAGASGSVEAPSKIFDNIIEVQSLPTNQEYSGDPPGGAFGIQVDESGSTPPAGSTKEIYDNDITVTAGTEGTCIRLTEANEPTIVRNNILRVDNVTGTYSAAFSIYGLDGSQVIEDNTVITDSGIISRITNCQDMVFERTTVQVVSPIATPHIFYTQYQAPGVTSDVSLLDTVFADATARTYVEDATVKVFYPYNDGDTTASVTIDWTTTIQVNDSDNAPIAGATVTIDDDDSTEVFSGTTDGNGRCIAILRQQDMTGATKTTYNDHTVTVTATGETFSPVTFTADDTQTITVTAQ